MSDLAISTITVAEIQQGIEQLRRTEASAKLARLEPWLEGILRGYNERVLAFDVSAAILTRNLKHFSPLGAPCLDPFEA